MVRGIAWVASIMLTSIGAITLFSQIQADRSGSALPTGLTYSTNDPSHVPLSPWAIGLGFLLMGALLNPRLLNHVPGLERFGIRATAAVALAFFGFVYYVYNPPSL